MSKLNGCIEHLKELDNNCQTVTGCIMLDDWRPFSYIMMILDFDNIVETNLIKSGCYFKPWKYSYSLLYDDRYVVKFIKISKFDEFNLTKFGCVLNDSLSNILKAGGKDYVAQFEQINKFTLEE